MWRRLSVAVRCYHATVVMLAVVAGALAGRAHAPLPTRHTVLLATAALMTAAAVSAAYGDVLGVRRGQSEVLVTISSAFHLAAALLLPFPLALAVPAATVVGLHVRRRPVLFKQLFNLAVYTLSMVTAAAAFRVVVGDAAAADVLRFVVAAGVACAAYGTVDIALFVVYIRLAVGLRARATGLVAVTEKASQLSFGALFAGLWHGSPVLVVLLAPIAVMLQREVFFRSVERASRTDVKTGLLNARAFRAEAERDLRRAARTSQPAALLMLDLDHLREVNNRHGHLAGDLAIARVAQVLREEVRDYDLAARFGGEEFAVLLPGTTAEQAVVIAERIRRAIAATALDVGDSAITIGVSVGVADSAVNGPALDDVIAAADQALYAAKAAGRNTVRAVHRLDGIALSNAGGAAPETG